MLGKGSLENLLVYYPTIEIGEGRSKKTEYQNRHNVMYMEAMETKEKADSVRCALEYYILLNSDARKQLKVNFFK